MPPTVACNEPSCFFLRDPSHWNRQGSRGALNELELAGAQRGSKRRTSAFKAKGKEKSLQSTSVACLKGSPTHATASASKRLSPRRADRTLSAGVNANARSTSSNDVGSRPPSRQRHAFPTHLIDTNAFDATPSTARSRRHSKTFCTGLGSETPDRPPSRYLVKAKRPTQDASGWARRVAFPSSNQAHHDPKTDGFADVDEKLPPPFQIQVTTASPMAGKDGRDRRAPLRRLQWLDQDAQLYNAHLFETVITLASPRLAVPVTMEDEVEDEERLQGPSLERVAQARQWSRPSDRPSSRLDAMDPQVAIEQTPLYLADDCMTVPARALTDLHLDDYSALHDEALALHVPVPTARLRTSLGMDFLSLFAQH